MKTISFSGKYIAKMFSLKRLLVSFKYFETEFFVRVVRSQNEGHVSLKSIP